MIQFSFEFFPPKTPASAKRLESTLAVLSKWRPAFASVTCGAGGQGDTLATVCDIMQRYPALQMAAHLTCTSTTREQTEAQTKGYRKAGIRHIVALRGDLPKGYSRKEALPGYQNAVELVQGLRQQNQEWEISVAAYPETHREALSRHDDLLHLRRKVESGAHRAITQFFFRNHDYWQLCEDAQTKGINVPIVPGILPIRHFQRTLEFAERCGASIPPELSQQFQRFQDPSSTSRLAIDLAVQQCSQLYEQGVRHFHFYTLNHADLVEEICRQLVPDPPPLIPDPPPT